MPLSQDQISQISQAVGVSVDELSSAITSEETVELAFTKTQHFNNDEIKTLQDQIGKAKYDEGRKAGEEITVKNLKKETGLEFEGKSLDTFVSAFTAKIQADSKIKVDDQVKNLNDQLAAQKQANEAALVELEAQKGKFEAYTTRQEVLNHIPESLGNGLIGRNEGLTLIEQVDGFSFGKSEDGAQVVKDRGGNVVTDHLKRPLAYKEFLDGHFQSKGWLNADQTGRGGDDSKPTSGNYLAMRKSSEITEYIKSKGINPMSDDAAKIYNEVSASARKSGEQIEYDDV